MAASWLLQALYTSLLGGSGLQGRADDVYLLANTSCGTLRGKVDLQPQVPVAKFFGIPYSKPPTGPLRFKPPVAPDSWPGTRDALDFSHQCMQPTFDEVWMVNGHDQPRSEDCLYLNVYTPTQGNAQASLPVMVWIHGGGYAMGAGSQYDATSLATRGVVMVTINYRLDVFGFLSTEDDVMPGNYGMMDQVAALRWVQGNIAAFGGDPGRVTVFGESSGSSSVSLLILSPLTKGLFQRGIMESGVSLVPWGVSNPGNRVSPRAAARLISVNADCNELDNSTRLLECLQSVDAATLLNCSLSVTSALDTGRIMKPRVETTYGFLPNTPSRLLARGEFNHVDTIRGFNKDEMGDLLTYVLGNSTGTTKENAKDIFKAELKQFTPLTQDTLMKTFEDTFLARPMTDAAVLYTLRDSLDALVFIAPIIVEINEVVKSDAQTNHHYLYQFSHKPSWLVNKTASYISAVHTDEIFFVFNVSQKQVEESEKGPADDSDRIVSEQMMEMWVNFAKTGDPSSTMSAAGAAAWRPFTSSDPNYLGIDVTSYASKWVGGRSVDFFRKVLEELDGTDASVDTNIVG